MAQWPPRPQAAQQQQQQQQALGTVNPFAAMATTAWTPAQPAWASAAGQRSQTPQRAVSPRQERQRSQAPGMSSVAAMQCSPEGQRSVTPMRQRGAPHSVWDACQAAPPQAQPPAQQRSPTPQQQHPGSLQPMVSYVELPTGDYERAHGDAMEPLPTVYGEPMIGTICNLIEPGPRGVGGNAPSSGEFSQPMCSYVAPPPPAQALSSGPNVAVAPPLQPTAMSFQGGATIQTPIPLAPYQPAPSPPAPAFSQGPQGGLPASLSYIPPLVAHHGSYVAQAPSFVAAPPAMAGSSCAPSVAQAASYVAQAPVIAGQSLLAPSYSPSSSHQGQSLLAPSYFSQGMQPHMYQAMPAFAAQPCVAAAPVAQAAVMGSPSSHRAHQVQSIQPQWQYSSHNGPAAMQMAVQHCTQYPAANAFVQQAQQQQQHQQHQQQQHHQAQQQQQQQPLQQPLQPERVQHVQQVQPHTGRQQTAPTVEKVEWPQQLTAKQALFMSKVPSLPEVKVVHASDSCVQPVKANSEPVSSSPQAVAEEVDAMTKTQEIYIYPVDEQRATTPLPATSCDDISFAGELGDAGSIVIHGGNAHLLVNTEGCVQQAISAENCTTQEITRCLVDSAEDGDLEGLREAIRRAMLAGMDQDLIDWAHCRREVLEEENWSLRVHRGASQELQEATQNNKYKSTEFLKAALERAQSVGVQGSLLKKARDELAKRNACQEAEEALYSALGSATKGSSCTGLAIAIDRAQEAGVSAELIKHARSRLTEVEEYTSSRKASSHAEQKLLKLVSSCDDVSKISEALETAREAGACLKVIGSARKKKAELEEEVWQAQSRDCAALRSERTIDDHPLSESVPTPMSTIGIVEEARDELHKLMHMPTQALSEAEQPSQFPSPIPTMEAEVSACADASQAREPASEPTVTLEASLKCSTPGTERKPINPLADMTNMTPPRPSLPEDEIEPTPAPRSSWRPSVLQEEAVIYGLDAELKAKAEAKYDLSAEDQASHWVQAITGVQVVGEFGEALRTGQVLCQLVNCIKPGTIGKINTAGMPFKERENISKFLKVCRDWGVHEYALFSTDDLYDEKNLMSVVKCIHQLGGVLKRAVPDFQGPCLGVADKSSAKRDQKRDLEHASQTGGLHSAMGKSHIDVISNGNVRAATTRGGC